MIRSVQKTPPLREGFLDLFGCSLECQGFDQIMRSFPELISARLLSWKARLRSQLQWKSSHIYWQCHQRGSGLTQPTPCRCWRSPKSKRSAADLANIIYQLNPSRVVVQKTQARSFGVTWLLVVRFMILLWMNSWLLFLWQTLVIIMFKSICKRRDPRTLNPEISPRIVMHHLSLSEFRCGK